LVRVKNIYIDCARFVRVKGVNAWLGWRVCMKIVERMIFENYVNADFRFGTSNTI